MLKIEDALLLLVVLLQGFNTLGMVKLGQKLSGFVEIESHCGEKRDFV